MTLNKALYAEHRSAVERKLARNSRDYIAALEIVRTTTGGPYVFSRH